MATNRLLTTCISLLIIRAFAKYLLVLTNNFLSFTCLMTSLTLEQKKTLHAKQRLFTGMYGMKPIMIGYACSASYSLPFSEVQAFPTIDLDAQSNIVNSDGTPKKETSSSSPSGKMVWTIQDKDFDTRGYVQTHMHFRIYFRSDHRMEAHMGTKKMENALETHMLRGFLLERTMFDAYSQFEQ